MQALHAEPGIHYRAMGQRDFPLELNHIPVSPDFHPTSGTLLFPLASFLTCAGALPLHAAALLLRLIRHRPTRLLPSEVS